MPAIKFDYAPLVTHKQRLAAIETDLGKLISDIIAAKKSLKFDQAVERGILVGQLTAAESIIAVVREDMPENYAQPS